MNLGNAIKRLRKVGKTSRKALAEDTGLSVTALYNIENGLSFPSKETIVKICSSLGIPESYLLVFAVEDSEVSMERRTAFRSLMIPLRMLLLEDAGIVKNDNQE